MGQRIEPYQYIVNLRPDLQHTLGSNLARLDLRALNKLAKLFMPLTKTFEWDQHHGHFRYDQEADATPFHDNDWAHDRVRLIPYGNSQWRHLRDWMAEALIEPGNNVVNMIMGVSSMFQLINVADDYFRSKVKYADTEGEIETIMVFDGGYQLVRLLDKQAYEHEGHRMNNCVDSYWKKHVKSRGRIHVLSLRTKDSIPVADLEVHVKGKVKTITQIEGKHNRPVGHRYTLKLIRQICGLEVGKPRQQGAPYQPNSEVLMELGLLKISHPDLDSAIYTENTMPKIASHHLTEYLNRDPVNRD